MSKRIRGVIPAYMRYKYEADKNLVNRTAFKWTIVRAGGLTNDSGSGKLSIGRTHLMPMISVRHSSGHNTSTDSISYRQRDDLAELLALLVRRDDAAGLAIDAVGGETPIKDGLDTVIQKGETDFLG